MHRGTNHVTYSISELCCWKHQFSNWNGFTQRQQFWNRWMTIISEWFGYQLDSPALGGINVHKTLKTKRLHLVTCCLPWTLSVLTFLLFICFLSAFSRWPSAPFCLLLVDYLCWFAAHDGLFKRESPNEFLVASSAWQAQLGGKRKKGAVFSPAVMQAQHLDFKGECLGIWPLITALSMQW